MMLEALIALGLYDVLKPLGFKSVARIVPWMRARRPRRTTDARGAIAQVIASVDEACIFYPREALCLQRSVVAALLLNRRGCHAEVVIGVRPMPLASHAWVEYDGEVINDLPQYKKKFLTLDRI